MRLDKLCRGESITTKSNGNKLPPRGACCRSYFRKVTLFSESDNSFERDIFKEQSKTTLFTSNVKK
jgi:hypothetical protein